MAKLGRVSMVVMALAGVFVVGCNSAGGDMAILDVQPRTGATQGEQAVRIIGKNFRPDIGYTVFFGNKESGAVTIRDPETLDVVTPQGMPAGPVDIMIRSDDGSAFRIKQAFAFKDMGGSVVGGLGESGGGKEENKGNLAY